MKRIEFSLNNDIAFIYSSSQTVMKLWISSPPFMKINWTELTIKDKFNALTSAFEASKKDLPMPENPQEFSKSILKAFGLTSWRAFYEKGKHCSITLNPTENQYNFTPSIYLRENKSLYGIKDGIETIPITTSPEDVISTLERLLEKIPRLEEEYYKRESETEDPLI